MSTSSRHDGLRASSRFRWELRAPGMRCAPARSSWALLRAAVCTALAGALLALTLFGVTATRALAAWSQPSGPLAPSHALPVSYYPAQNAVLRTPPDQVRITFSELLNADISKLVVVNPSNQEVDSRDSRVSSDGFTMTVSLPLLAAGTYVVFWRTHSAVDGHVASGSYLFHVARADGTVPPFTGPLPRGTFAGGAGAATGVDGPTLVGGVARWVTLLSLTLLLGMIFWALFVQPRQRLSLAEPGQEQSGEAISPALLAASRRRMRMLARRALWTLLGATVVEIGAQAWLLNGDWRGLVSPTLLESILLTSRFGEAITLRIALALVGLLALWLSRPRGEEPGAEQGGEPLFDPRVALIAFGVFLALTYEYSGHGASAGVWWGPIIDFLHLMANGVWLGGLFTIALVIAPALRATDATERSAYLSSRIHAFSVPALIAVAFVIVTGPLNATVRLSNVAQLWMTAYGIVLLVKSALFLAMVAISYYHAFVLRPLLASVDIPAKGAKSAPAVAGGKWAQTGLLRPVVALAEQTQRSLQMTRARAFLARAEHGGAGYPVAGAEGDSLRKPIERAIPRWWRIEAGVGVAVLLCAALMGPLAGTLEAPTSATASFGAKGGAQTQTQQVDGLTVTMNANPGTFGENTFTVTIKNPDGKPASGASVFIVSSMVEMDMGENTINLTPTGTPGAYSGQGALAMAGHWRLRTVIRTREDPNHLHTTTFTVSAGY